MYKKIVPVVWHTYLPLSLSATNKPLQDRLVHICNASHNNFNKGNPQELTMTWSEIQLTMSLAGIVQLLYHPWYGVLIFSHPSKQYITWPHGNCRKEIEYLQVQNVLFITALIQSPLSHGYWRGWQATGKSRAKRVGNFTQRNFWKLPMGIATCVYIALSTLECQCLWRLMDLWIYPRVRAWALGPYEPWLLAFK